MPRSDDAPATVTMLKDLAAGTSGGFAITLVGHPFDTLKVRLQTQPVDKPIYSGFVDCVRKTVQWEGLGGFYKGVASPLVGNALFNAVQFLGYGQAKKLVAGPGGNPDNLTVPQYFQVGLLTGALVAFVESPIDLFKSQVQSQIFEARLNPAGAAQAQGVFGVVRDVTSRFGVRGFYQGLAPTLMRDVPAVCMYFGTYEWARRAMLRPGQRLDELGALKTLSAGGVGGFFYWAATYPIDVIKSSMQTDAVDPAKRRYKSVADCARKLYAQGGARRFTVGLTPCLLRSIPGNAACFLAYELTRDALG